MTTLATLSATAQSAVDALCSKIENKKDWTISTIAAVYASDSAITPQHILAGVKKKSSIGEVYAGWYAHKSGVSSANLNIRFIAENYASILVKDNATDMQAELKRVAGVVRDAQALADRVAAEKGEATLKALSELDKEFDRLANVIIVPSASADAQVMALQDKFNNLVTRYKSVAESRESVLSNA